MEGSSNTKTSQIPSKPHTHTPSKLPRYQPHLNRNTATQSDDCNSTRSTSPTSTHGARKNIPTTPLYSSSTDVSSHSKIPRPLSVASQIPTLKSADLPAPRPRRSSRNSVTFLDDPVVHTTVKHTPPTSSQSARRPPSAISSGSRIPKPCLAPRAQDDTLVRRLDASFTAHTRHDVDSNQRRSHTSLGFSQDAYDADTSAQSNPLPSTLEDSPSRVSATDQDGDEVKSALHDPRSSGTLHEQKPVDPLLLAHIIDLEKMQYRYMRLKQENEQLVQQLDQRTNQTRVLMAENEQLKEGGKKNGNAGANDDQIWREVLGLMEEKSRLLSENARLTHENRSLQAKISRLNSNPSSPLSADAEPDDLSGTSPQVHVSRAHDAMVQQEEALMAAKQVGDAEQIRRIHEQLTKDVSALNFAMHGAPNGANPANPSAQPLSPSQPGVEENGSPSGTRGITCEVSSNATSPSLIAPITASGVGSGETSQLSPVSPLLQPQIQAEQAQHAGASLPPLPPGQMPTTRLHADNAPRLQAMQRSLSKQSSSASTSQETMANLQAVHSLPSVQLPNASLHSDIPAPSQPLQRGPSFATEQSASAKDSVSNVQAVHSLPSGQIPNASLHSDVPTPHRPLQRGPSFATEQSASTSQTATNSATPSAADAPAQSTLVASQNQAGAQLTDQEVSANVQAGSEGAASEQVALRGLQQVSTGKGSVAREGEAVVHTEVVGTSGMGNGSGIIESTGQEVLPGSLGGNMGGDDGGKDVSGLGIGVAVQESEGQRADGAVSAAPRMVDATEQEVVQSKSGSGEVQSVSVRQEIEGDGGAVAGTKKPKKGMKKLWSSFKKAMK